jgi:AAA+ superfamily predicted ATPase
MDPKSELTTCIKSGCPFVYIVSQEEGRIEANVGAVANSLSMGVRTWSLTNGFTALDGSAQENCPDPSSALSSCAQGNERTIYILKDFHPFLDSANAANVPVVRLARDIINLNQLKSKCIVFIGPAVSLPKELESEVTLLEWPLPTEAEIRALLERTIERGLSSNGWKSKEVRANVQALQNGAKDEVVRSALGLTLKEAENCFAKSLITLKTFDPATISQEKKQTIAKDGLLEWIAPEGGLEQVGGLEVLKQWLEQRVKAFSKKAKEFGLPTPKGVAVVGLPGTGKSLCAKAAGIAWRMPVIRLDMGKLYGGLLGETENNLRRALKIAESSAPCILMLDEIDKGLGGNESSGGSTDGGTSQRVLGGLLTWMQEKKAPVFVFATLNRAEGLPAEIFRRGRFDDVFFVDLPTSIEREAIWKVHISKRDRDTSKFDLATLVKQSEGYSGAEIEASFVDGMFDAFSAEQEVTTEHVLKTMETNVPLSKMASDKIAAMRDWAKGRAKMASKVEAETDSTRLDALEI